MIITRKHAMALIKAGRATIIGATYEPDHASGERDHVIVNRHDVPRTDHYRYTDADKAAVDAAESLMAAA